MKESLILPLLIGLACANSLSQNFPMDSNGAISYTEVVEVDSFKVDSLFRNAVKYMTLRLREKVVVSNKDSLAGKFSGSSSFLVYSSSDVLKKVSGRISYSFSIEVKENKYRYSFTDFIFHYCKPDRTYQMRETGKTRRLEELEAPGWQKLWTKHRNTCHRKLLSNISKLKSSMKERVQPPAERSQKTSVEW